MQVGITGSHGFIGSQLYKKLKIFTTANHLIDLRIIYHILIQ
jgi:nucleoside-diphosphate-sugar epimerase